MIISRDFFYRLSRNQMRAAFGKFSLFCKDVLKMLLYKSTNATLKKETELVLLRQGE